MDGWAAAVEPITHIPAKLPTQWQYKYSTRRQTLSIFCGYWCAHQMSLAGNLGNLDFFLWNKTNVFENDNKTDTITACFLLIHAKEHPNAGQSCFVQVVRLRVSP